MTPQPRSAPARTRRQLLGAGLAAACTGLLRVQPAGAAASPAFEAALQQLTGGAVPQHGRVQLEISPLVENGNAVPVLLWLDSPMTEADHVRRLALLTERNPQPEVAVFQLSRLSGRARVATRIRLATSQTLWALAETGDGRWWMSGAEVVVTLAACVEG
ncbi:MAG: SoxY-related AACIE arm protein [Rubrivivax sp.]|nr:SoxY-related AACIE arm protein [Rubrivivax sp.]